MSHLHPLAFMSRSIAFSFAASIAVAARRRGFLHAIGRSRPEQDNVLFIHASRP
jgi:hypothetical protein